MRAFLTPPSPLLKPLRIPDVVRSVYVVIPTHGRASLLGRTLASLAACELPDAYGGTVVVENGARGGAERAVARASAAHPHLRLEYLHHGRANKSAALNAALGTIAEDGALAVFFDDDVRVGPGVLTAYADAARREGGAAYFGGPVSCDYEEPPPEWLRPALPHSARGYELDDRGVMAGEYLGFNWAAPVADVRAAGGFNPLVGPGSPTGARGQETEMQRRLRERGARPVDVEGARVWHYVPSERSSLRWLVGRRTQMGRSRGLAGGAGAPRSQVVRSLVRSALSLGKRAVLLDRTGAVHALCGVAGSVGALQTSFQRGVR